MPKLFCCITLLMPVMLFAQTTPTQESVKTNIEEYGANFQQEKMYIQFDKAAYAPGETIWYKAYLMTATENSEKSKNLYVDFVDADGNVLMHVISPVVFASAQGNFDIPLSFTGKNIYVKAYTKWMLNFDSAFLFRKDIRVIQTKAAVTKTNLPAVKTAVDFFPESGDCIAGMTNKIAFKAVSYNGRPSNIKGTVVNAKGEAVAEIKCIHDGMGYFALEPKQGDSFTAKWKDESGVSYETALPAVKNSGISLEVKIAANARGFIIKRSDNVPEALKKVHIVGTMFQQLVYMATVNLQNSSLLGGSIPTTELPSGILQLTLFDSNWVAVAERITFINNNEYHFEPEVGFAALGTGKRGKNTLVINLPDSIQSNLSVSVTDGGIAKDSTDDIISHLLLTGDLKGSVYKPSYYFVDNSDTLMQQLDLVMLTNGWRRIKWDDLVYGKMPQLKYPGDTAYLSLAGKVYGASAADLRESPVLLMILDHQKDTSRQLVQTVLNKDGSFNQPDIILYDTTKVYYKFSGKNIDNSAAVTFDNGMISSRSKINLDKSGSILFIDTAAEARDRYFAEQQARLAKLLQGTTLAGVTVKAKTKSPMQVLDEKYASGLFSGGNAKQFDVLNDPAGRSSMNVLSYLQGKVAGLIISGSGSLGSSQSVMWRGGTPAFYLDEMPVDISQLTSINMSNVGYVKVFEPPFFGAFGGGANGAIAVYTQKGGATTTTGSGKGLPYKFVIGYTAQKEFYSPNYATFDKRNEEEDLRSTLYWNPAIITTKENHIIKLTFFNNDITNSFRVIVEGVSNDGKLTHVEKLIE